MLTREELLWRAGDVFRWIGSGKLKLRIDKTYPLADAAEAHRDLEGRKTAGQVAADPLMPINTVEENRRASAASLFAESKLDALLVTNLHNVRYLTGFTGSNGAVLLLREGRRFCLPIRVTRCSRSSR